MKTLPLFLCLLLPLSALTVRASTLYKCADGSGVVLYTNQKTNSKDCIVLSQQPAAASEPQAAGARNVKPRANATPTPADFPRVSSTEQKVRDTDRRAILEKELANEQQSLDKAKRASLEAANLPADKLQALRDTQALHERNIEALKKELANLR